jgi:hypothetical protein
MFRRAPVLVVHECRRQRIDGNPTASIPALAVCFRRGVAGIQRPHATARLAP